LLTTSQHGQDNVMTLSWHMMMEFEPPLIACVVSEGDFSFKALNETGQCVLAVPPLELAKTVVAIGNCSGCDTDKFEVFGLAKRPARRVAAPLIEAAIANLECEVRDRRLVADYDLFVLEAVSAWIDPALANAKTIHHRGLGVFVTDGRELKLDSKMR
jgi:flavin reductase (DIM6/NTAB) family NADH-FMN oxidoreductase RutF